MHFIYVRLFLPYRLYSSFAMSWRYTHTITWIDWLLVCIAKHPNICIINRGVQATTVQLDPAP